MPLRTSLNSEWRHYPRMQSGPGGLTPSSSLQTWVQPEAASSDAITQCQPIVLIHHHSKTWVLNAPHQQQITELNNSSWWRQQGTQARPSSTTDYWWDLSCSAHTSRRPRTKGAYYRLAVRFDPPDAGKRRHVGNLFWGLSLSCLPPAQAPGTTCARRPGSGGARQRPLFQLLFSLWMSLISLACLSRVTSPDLAPWVPRSEKRQCCPSSPHPWGEEKNADTKVPQTTPYLCLWSSKLVLPAPGCKCLGAWPPRPSALCFSWSLLLRQLQVNLGYSASRAASGGQETTESAPGPGPVALFPPPLLHAPGLCHGHLFSTGLLICLTGSRPTAFLITAKPESPVLPTHNKNHLIK